MKAYLPSPLTVATYWNLLGKAVACLVMLFVLFLCDGLPPAWAETPTITTLKMTMDGEPVTSVDQYHAVSLTATVKAGSTALTLGQVKFCDATAIYCEDNHLLSLQQLTKAGKSEFKFVPGPGIHSYKAIFVGTNSYASSASDALPLRVSSATASSATKTSIIATGSNGSYSLTAGVTGGVEKLPILPTGDVYFSDRSDSHATLGRAKLPTWLPAVNYTGTSTLFPGLPSVEYFRGVGVSADFNGDGNPDMALCYGNLPPIVLAGNGHGAFTQLSSKPVGGSSEEECVHMVIGDFNMDGVPDIVTTTIFLGGAGYVNALYLGCGDGTLYPSCKAGEFKGPVVPFQSGASSPHVQAVGDFNHDGIPDLVAVNDDTSNIGIELGKGDGKFKPGWQSASIPAPGGYGGYGPTGYSVGVGDFNGDGIEDFATIADYNGSEKVAVFFGTTDGTFTETDVLTDYVQGDLGYISVGDFNGDGRTDFVINSGYSGANGGPYFPEFYVMLGRPDKTFEERSIIGLDLDQTAEPAIVADFNGDGILDLVSADLSGALMLLGQGDGSFTQVSRIAAPTATGPIADQGFAAEDFNGDGLPDLAAVGSQPGSNQMTFGALLTLVGQNASASIQPPTGPGVHQVVARYEGDDNFVTSVSPQIALSGLTTPAPVATISTTFLQFGDQPIKNKSDARTALLTNTGTAALSISGISIIQTEPPFATSNDCPASLAPGNACKIRVRFYPFGLGAKLSQLAITDNAANSPQVITLTGTAVEAP